MKSLETISEIALTLSNSGNFDGQIRSVLKILGEQTGVSNVYILTENVSRTSSEKEFEWRGRGVLPERSVLQSVPFEVLASWKEELQKSGSFCSENISGLPDSLKAALEARGANSIVVFPLVIDDSVRGFICFDEARKCREWSPEELGLLKTISAVISGSFQKNLSQERLRASEENFHEFFNALSELVLIVDRQGRIIFANKSVESALGYSLMELLKMNIVDLHPEAAGAKYLKVIESLDGVRCEICGSEFKRKDGSLFPAECSVWAGHWNGMGCVFCLSKDISVEQESLQKFTKLFENNPALMALSSVPDRKILDVNKAYLSKLGYSKEEIIRKTGTELGLLVDEDNHRHIADILREKGRISDLELEVRCKDGSILNVLFARETIENNGDKYYLTVMADISEEIRLRRSLESQKERLKNIIMGTRLGTWEWNVKTGATIINERWAEMAGYTIEELQPISIRTWLKLAHPEDMEKSNSLLQKHFKRESEYYECETRMKHKSGRWIWVLDKGKVTEWDKEGKPLLMFGTHTDITESKVMQRRIEQLSIRDPLTNIFNRRYIFERLYTLLAEFRRNHGHFSVSLLDIDYFKRINDEYGHMVGDEVLKDFTRIIRTNLRPYDLLGRYGGEEFLVVSLNSKKEQSKLIIERILESVANRACICKDREICLTFSCGLTDCFDFDRELISVERIIKKADDRLYTAKLSGRKRIVIYDK